MRDYIKGIALIVLGLAIAAVWCMVAFACIKAAWTYLHTGHI